MSLAAPGRKALWAALGAACLAVGPAQADTPEEEGRAAVKTGARYARYTFGTLGGKRQMRAGQGHLFYLGQERELVAVPLPAEGELPPAPPEAVGSLKLQGVPEALEWAADSVLCVSTGNHLQFVEAREPARLLVIAELAVAAEEMDGVSDLRRAGASLYVAARSQGLVVVDVADPAHPRRSGSLRFKGWGLGIDVQGDLAAVATGRGLALVRLGPGGPRLESELDTVRHAEVARFDGKRVVLASKEYLFVVDVSDPRRPVELGEVPTRDPFFHSHLVSLHIERGRAFGAAIEGGLYVFDLGDGRSPSVLAQFSYWGNEKRITTEGRIAYLEALGVQGSREDLIETLPVVENVHVPAVGMVVLGRRVFLADTKGRLWGLEVELDGGTPSIRCRMRPD